MQNYVTLELTGERSSKPEASTRITRDEAWRLAPLAEKVLRVARSRG